MTIQATFFGNVSGQAIFQPPRPAHQALVSFSVFTGPAHARSYVRCRLRGPKAESLHQYLVAGKRVLCSGELCLVTDVGRPFLGCAVHSIELLGGGVRAQPGDLAEVAEQTVEAERDAL